MRDTNGLRKYANEKSQTTGNGGGNRGRRQATDKSRLEAEAAFARCAKCGNYRWLHQTTNGLIPDHAFEDANDASHIGVAQQ